MNDDKARHCEMKIRLNAEEYLALANAARSRNLSIAACFRELLIEGMKARQEQS